MLNDQKLKVVDAFIGGGQFTDEAAMAAEPPKPAKNNLQIDFAAHSQRGQLLQMTIKFEFIIVLGSLATTHDLSFAEQI